MNYIFEITLLGKGALLLGVGCCLNMILIIICGTRICRKNECERFLWAFRCVGLKGTNDNDKYFVMYDVKNKDILSSKQYLNRLNNPTD